MRRGGVRYAFLASFFLKNNYQKSAQNVGFVDAGELKLKGREQAIACFYVVAASEKDRIAREMSSNNVSPHHQGLVRAQSMCSQVSKSSKVTSGTSMSSRSSISSFGSLFSLPRMFQANAAYGLFLICYIIIYLPLKVG